MNLYLRICFLILFYTGMISSLVHAAPIDCYQFFPGMGESMNCEEVPGVAHPAGSNKFRIFHFVEGWPDDLPHRNLIEDIQDAFNKAPPIFMKYGALPSIHIVITNEFVPNGVEYGAVASIYEEPLQNQPCLVRIFQDFLRPGWAREEARQVLAHEIFHCFQFKNRFLGEFIAPDRSNRWWVEGSAEFFSNLVYPRANEEFRHTRHYDTPIPLNAQSNPYTTTLFFQAISNLGSGPNTAMSLLRQMPNPSTHDLVVQSLSSFPQMDSLFHRFGQALYDDTINDTGGGKVPLPPLPGKQLIQVEAKARDYEFDIVPFAIDAKTLKFMPGGKYTVSTRPSLTSSTESYSMKKAKLDIWHGLSGEGYRFEVGCKDNPLEYTLLLTSIAPKTEVVPGAIHVEYEPLTCECVEKAALDGCLIGTWILDDPVFSETYAGWARNTLHLDLVSAALTGEVRLDVTREKDFTMMTSGVLLDFIIRMGMNTMETRSTYDGPFGGKLFLQEKGKVCARTDYSNLKTTISVEGEEPTDTSDVTNASSKGVVMLYYQCSPKKLALHWEMRNHKGPVMDFLRKP